MSRQLLVASQQNVQSAFTQNSAGTSSSWLHSGSWNSKKISNFGGRTTLSLSGGCKNGPCGSGVQGVQRRYSIQEVHVDPKLLEPFHVSISPEIQKTKHEEMEQIKSLNGKFAGFIDQVQDLEQKNQMPETKWNLLQQQVRPPRGSFEFLYELFIASLRRQVDYVSRENRELLSDSENTRAETADSKNKYEETVNQHVAAEKEIAELRKYEKAQDKRSSYKGDLKNRKQQISELIKQIEKVQYEIQSLQEENEELEKTVCEATKDGEQAFQEALQKSTGLAEVLQNSKDELVRILREYQELLNVKIILDIDLTAG